MGIIDTDDISEKITRPRPGTFHARHDPQDGETVCHTLVLAVAAIADRDPLSLDPLYRTVDPDTLDDFVESSDPEAFEGSVSFAYEGYDVTVYASGLIEIERSRE